MGRATRVSSTYTERVDPKPCSRIGRDTNMDDVVQHLIHWGCPNAAGRFEPLSMTDTEIGHGGFGRVYSVELTGGHQAAAKVINTVGQARNRVLKNISKEIAAWYKHQHKNILPFLGFARVADNLVMISPRMQYGTLLDYITQNPRANRYRLSLELCQAVDYLHLHGYVHGDIKGGNTMVSHCGTIKLADFGSCRGRNHSRLFTTTTSSPAITIRYASPELMEGHSLHNTPSDVWALGMTILEAFTGQLPFHGKTTAAIVAGVTTRNMVPDRPGCIPVDSELGENLWVLLTDCWSFNPEDRPSASEVTNTMKLIFEADLASHGSSSI